MKDLKEKIWFPVVYMFIATLFFSAILIVFGNLTGQRVADNERIAFERAVLEAMAIKGIKGMSLPNIHTLYIEVIKDSNEFTGGALRYVKNDSLLAYALPIQGPGFWAEIKGVIGIAADKVTITGISFYEQNETPGLGAEIVKSGFRNQFIGKTLSDKDMPLDIRMASAELDEHSVHAVTGATQTSNRLEKFINPILKKWQDAMRKKGEQ